MLQSMHYIDMPSKDFSWWVLSSWRIGNAKMDVHRMNVLLLWFLWSVDFGEQFKVLRDGIEIEDGIV